MSRASHRPTRGRASNRVRHHALQAAIQRFLSTFYRPTLDNTGFRAIRAWGGLANEDYCDLVLKVIEKSGIVWADVSELNPNVLYEVGAAHGLGKLAMLVARDDLE